MSLTRRRNVSSPTSTSLDGEPPSVTGDNSLIVLEDLCLNPEIAQLRSRWELACVLNFLNVFEPLIGGNLKLTAEEIEAGLMKPDAALTRLHIELLKGIPPVSKTLHNPDVWVTVLCKKLKTWWPWVAKDEIPLTAAKGEEMTRYMELDPVNRLIILKALCEIRADQNDVVSYINDSIKTGTEVSRFRKYKIGEDRNAAFFWFDGNEQIGHRMYKEVRDAYSKTKLKSKLLDDILPISFQWKTVATNLEEFQSIVNDLSSSEVKTEVDLGKNIKGDFLPILENLRKKKERALERKQRQEKILNDFRTFAARTTRSCRLRSRVNYTFDEFDRNIDEAINLSKKRKTTEDICAGMLDKDHEQGNSQASESESKDLEADNDADSGEMVSDSDYGGSRDGHGDIDEDSDRNLCVSHGDDDNGHDTNDTLQPVVRTQHNKEAKITRQAILDGRTVGAKNRLRQRPIYNSAIEPQVPDSEDDNSSEHKSISRDDVVDDSEVSGSSSP